MNHKVVEYLGLPASGKTWQLSNAGYCGVCNAIPHSVPLGGGKYKFYNTIKGVLHNPKLFFLLCKLGWKIFREERPRFLLRPFLVIFERYGRMLKLKNRTGHAETHMDEGVFQFLWRVFSELSKTSENLCLLEKCITLLKPREHHLVYVSCPKDKHIKQVTERKKISSNFDASIVKGDKETYLFGRFWMAQVLKNARNKSFEISFVWNK